MITRGMPVVFGLVIAMSGCQGPSPSDTAPINYTEFEVDASWPKNLPNNWILGQVAGIDVDADDNVWIVHRPLSLTESEARAMQDPPLPDVVYRHRPSFSSIRREMCYELGKDLIRKNNGPKPNTDSSLTRTEISVSPAPDQMITLS